MTIKDELLEICRTPYNFVESTFVETLDTVSPKKFRQAKMKKVFSCFALVVCFSIILASLLRLGAIWSGYFSQDNGMSLDEFMRNQAGFKTILFCFIIAVMCFFSLPSLLAFSESDLTIRRYKRQATNNPVEVHSSDQEEFQKAKDFIAVHVRSMMVVDVVALKNAPGVQEWAKQFLHQEIVRR